LEKIVWSIDARNDLIEIYNYISRDSIYYAIKTVWEITEKVKDLYYFPYIGKKSLLYKDEKYRERIYKSYKIIYKVESSNIYIHRVWHSARLINNLFLK